MDYYIQNEFQIKSTIEEKPGAGGGVRTYHVWHSCTCCVHVNKTMAHSYSHNYMSQQNECFLIIMHLSTCILSFFFQDIFSVIITRLFIMISYSSLKENCFFKEIYILSNTSFEAGRFEKNMLKMLNIINIVQKYKWTPLYALLHGNFQIFVIVYRFQFFNSINPLKL